MPVVDQSGPVTTSEQQALPVAGEAMYLIRKGGYFYRPNAQGYTISKAEAGRYTLADAISYSHPNGADGPRDGIDYLLADDIPPAVQSARLTEPARKADRLGEVEPIDDDEVLEAVTGCFNGSDIYGRTEAWAEGKTLSVLFKGTGQIAKLRFVKLVDKPSNADLRGDPA
jgi:hypothetical protein